MTLNPYESPQTIEESLPIATAVHPFVRTREGLIRAAALCVEGGRIQFAAGLLGILAVLLALQQHDPNADGHFEKLLLLISSVVTAVLWTWGAIKNYRGYLGLANYATNERLSNLYTFGVMQWWVQLVLTVLLLLSSGLQRDIQDFFFPALLGILILSFSHSILLQAKALRFWYARFVMPSAELGYLAGGMAVVLLLGLELALPLLGYREYSALHVILSFMLAVTAWDFSQRYQTVHEALLEDRDR